MTSIDTRFKPGQSGNPGGRPRGEHRVRELAQQYTAEALETLVQVMHNGRPSERVAAAVAILDRGWGKPAQEVTVHDNAKLSLVDLLTSLAGGNHIAEYPLVSGSHDQLAS